MKIAYRLEVTIRRGLLRRVRKRGLASYIIWDSFEGAAEAMTTRCLPLARAQRLYRKALVSLR